MTARGPKSRMVGTIRGSGELIPDKHNAVCRVAQAVGAVPTMCFPPFPSLIFICPLGRDRVRPTPIWVGPPILSRPHGAAATLQRRDSFAAAHAASGPPTKEGKHAITIVAPVSNEHATIKQGIQTSDRRFRLLFRPRSTHRFNWTDKLERIAQNKGLDWP